MLLSLDAGTRSSVALAKCSIDGLSILGGVKGLDLACETRSPFLNALGPVGLLATTKFNTDLDAQVMQVRRDLQPHLWRTNNAAHNEWLLWS